MMKTLPICLLIAALAGSIGAQTRTPQSNLASSIEKSIKTKETGWEFSSPAREAEPQSTFFQWKSGSQLVYFRVFVADSPEGAAAKFQEFSRHMPVPWKEKLKGRGDEALVWQGANTDQCMILFRRGNVLVQLNGSSSLHAKRFIKHLDDLFTAK